MLFDKTLCCLSPIRISKAIRISVRIPVPIELPNRSIVGTYSATAFRGMVPGLVERQMFDRPQRTTLTMRPGHDPRFVPGGLHAKNQTANLSVPELIGALSGL